MANNKKSDVSILVRGLGMGMAFLQVLTEELVAAGGFEEMIHFITKETARPLARKIAELIVKSDWKIPRSLMERLAGEESLEGNDGGQYYEWDKRFNWLSIMDKTFGIPVVGFNPEYREPPVPEEVARQIVGKPSTYPMIVQWAGEPHVVVAIYPDWEIGESVPECIDAIALAPVKYFNLEQ